MTEPSERAKAANRVVIEAMDAARAALEAVIAQHPDLVTLPEDCEISLTIAKPGEGPPGCACGDGFTDSSVCMACHATALAEARREGLPRWHANDWAATYCHGDDHNDDDPREAGYWTLGDRTLCTNCLKRAAEGT